MAKRYRDFHERMGFEDPLVGIDEDRAASVVSAAQMPGVAPGGRKKALTKTEREAKKATEARSQRSRISAATVRRRKWEASDAGQERMQDIHSLTGVDPSKYTKAQIYSSLGVRTEGKGYGASHLPGLENPHAAPVPPRWEDLTHEQRSETEHRLREYGTSLPQMTRDFGAQLDQSVMRAHRGGHFRESTGEPVPFTKHFYDEHPSDAPEPLDRPHETFRESRRYIEAQTGEAINPTVHTGVVSHVSPNVKFTQGPRGSRTSPNTEAAEAVVIQHRMGVPSSQVKSGASRRGIANQSRPANARRAALMLEQVSEGTSMGQARNLPSKDFPKGSPQWGAKTGPFVNSFDPHHPDFTVGDVHTGGGGMFPHLGTAKEFNRNPDGSLVRNREWRDDPRSDQELGRAEGKSVFQRGKSQREIAIERSGKAVPGSEHKKVTFHAAADYAVRSALAERGLAHVGDAPEGGGPAHIFGSVRQAQAMQWGEEQIQRKEAAPRLDLPAHEEAYPAPHHVLNPNQMKLF